MINKKVLILTVAAIILVLAFTYLARGAGSTTYTGSITLVDHAASQSDFTIFTPESYSHIIYLPTSNCEGSVTTCSFYFPTGVDAKYDVTKDGRIDSADLMALSLSYGCDNTQPCWNQVISFTDCYFDYKNRRFRDPNRDCVINQTDVNLVGNYYGQTTPVCDSSDLCNADINKDGKVDLYDLVLLAKKMNTAADEVNTYTIRESDLDFNGDGKVSLSDLALLAKVYGSVAEQQRCDTEPLVHVDGNKYEASASGRGIYHVATSYFCSV
jgi:Ca2+-binding EF-hand superfamily protein